MLFFFPYVSFQAFLMYRKSILETHLVLTSFPRSINTYIPYDPTITSSRNMFNSYFISPHVSSQTFQEVVNDIFACLFLFSFIYGLMETSYLKTNKKQTLDKLISTSLRETSKT